ncbi:MAG: adenine deaminase [Candidatus Cloacimonetes bacterium]|nr:adenine deaminase [Candidatus Cloacimonadota bacterium]
MKVNTKKFSERITKKISGRIVDPISRTIFEGSIYLDKSRISKIIKEPVSEKYYIMPGLIDAHVHIESSMLPPAEFSRFMMKSGIIATISDPHEIANVMGIEGIRYMIEESHKTPMRVFYGAPSCVPASPFETSGHCLDSEAVFMLLRRKDIFYLSEMMNYPGVIAKDIEIKKKISAAFQYGKPVDGHAPALRGELLKKYIDSGISTDHETITYEEGKEKIQLGMKIIIREGSASRQFEELFPLLMEYPEMCMFCTDDLHPDNLLDGTVRDIFKRALKKGADFFDVLQAASVNPIKHYHLPVGLLQPGDPADFIIVNNLEDLMIETIYINGVRTYDNGSFSFTESKPEIVNNVKCSPKKRDDFYIYSENPIKVIGIQNDQLITNSISAVLKKSDSGYLLPDTDNDILLAAVINRYFDTKPAVAFVKGFGLQDGAIASSVAHDSHNIIAVATSYEYLKQAVNSIIKAKGGLLFRNKKKEILLPLPIAGLMSDQSGNSVAKIYKKLNQAVHRNGSTLTSPFMTLSFIGLTVIPELKLSDKGLFDSAKFGFTDLHDN